MRLPDFSTDPAWQSFVDLLRQEMRSELPRLKREFRFRKGPHVEAAGSGATPLEDQRAYRQILHGRWVAAVRADCSVTKTALVREQIKDWGGIQRISDDMLRKFASSSSSELIGRGRPNVSSWSKALAIRNPRTFAVYDARVAMTLNSMQVQRNGVIEFFFPVPPTQNVAVKEARLRLQAHCSPTTQRLKGSEIYWRYLDALRKAKGGHSLHVAELWLYHVGPKWAQLVP